MENINLDLICNINYITSLVRDPIDNIGETLPKIYLELNDQWYHFSVDRTHDNSSFSNRYMSGMVLRHSSGLYFESIINIHVSLKCTGTLQFTIHVMQEIA